MAAAGELLLAEAHREHDGRVFFTRHLRAPLCIGPARRLPAKHGPGRGPATSGNACGPSAAFAVGGGPARHVKSTASKTRSRTHGFRFTAEEQAFRAEVRGFIRDNLPAEIAARLKEGRASRKQDIVAWQRILNKRGWAAYSWPQEWGGPGWSAVSA